MNYYQRHIGDTLKVAAHLSIMEHGVYVRIADTYYAREGAIPEGDVARLIMARTEDERSAVSAVLAEFFELVDGRYINAQFDEEIKKFKAGEPDREAKRQNERARQDRHRAARAELFETLRHQGLIPAFDTPTLELRRMAGQIKTRDDTTPVTPVTRDITPPVTRDDTATQYPVPKPDTQPQAQTHLEVVGGAAASPTQAPKPAAIAAAKRGARLSPDFELPKSWGKWAMARYPHWTDAVVRDLGAGFGNHWKAKTGKDATKLDWFATWQNWCMSDIAQRQYPVPKQATKPADEAAHRQARLAEARTLIEARSRIRDAADVIDASRKTSLADAVRLVGCDSPSISDMVVDQ